MAKKNKADPTRRDDQKKPEEFERFEELTEKLIRVSKPDLDRKRREAKPSRSAPGR